MMVLLRPLRPTCFLCFHPPNGQSSASTARTEGNVPFNLLVKDNTVLLHLLIKLILQAAHLAFDNLLDLIGQLRLHVFLQPTKQEWTEDFMKTADDEKGLFFVQLQLVL
jgi:hypothetical protein